jgi:flagellar hook protein FlgE
MNITWNFLDDLLQPRISSVAAASAVTDLSQNGSASAELVSISVADGGLINGLYSDGRTMQLAQLALARFTNSQALQAVGNNNFIRTASAGEPLEGVANSGGLGSIVGLSLETSNVDIAKEFTDLLTYQRGFQANSRVITTADELNQETLNLKR